MKILNLIWKYGTGGIAKCFGTYARLGDVDPSVEVLSVCIDPQDAEYDRSGLVRMGATCITIRNTHDFSWIGRLARTISSYRPDVVFTHGVYGPMLYLTTRLLYGCKVPLIGSFHGMYYAPNKKRKWLAPILNSMMMFIYTHACERVVAVSHYSARTLTEHGVPQGKIRVVHNGIRNMPLQEKGKGEGVLRIGVVSRLDPFKGIDVLIRSLAQIKNRTAVPFCVEVLGDGPMQEELQGEIDANGLAERVTLAGYCANVARRMEEWDIFCLPTFFENHSISILEAMRAGLPIVTTSVGGNGESVTDGQEALLVPPRDDKALSEALLRLMDDASLRTALGRNARLRYEREFTEEEMKKKLLEALTL